jgi:hypothetical protein
VLAGVKKPSVHLPVKSKAADREPAIGGWYAQEL